MTNHNFDDLPPEFQGDDMPLSAKLSMQRIRNAAKLSAEVLKENPIKCQWTTNSKTGAVPCPRTATEHVEHFTRTMIDGTKPPKNLLPVCTQHGASHRNFMAKAHDYAGG